MKRQFLLFALLALVAADAAARSGSFAAALRHAGVPTTGLGGRAVFFLVGLAALALASAAVARVRGALAGLRARRLERPAAAPQPAAGAEGQAAPAEAAPRRDAA